MRATAPLYGRVRRFPLTTKQAGKGFYKGTGSGAMGWHTKHGDYKIDPKKVRTYVVPEQLKDCKLTPFVTKTFEPTRGRFERNPHGALSGQKYLNKWKEENGSD